MINYIYEKDLFGMKYKIISSPFHEKTIAQIADCLDMNVQEFRKILIERLDMSFLENIPARYNSWKIMSLKEEDPVTSGLCITLFSEYIPVLAHEDVLIIKEKVDSLIKSGIPEDEAVLKGKILIREIFLAWV